MLPEPLTLEEYAEPRCPFCREEDSKPIPLDRMIEKLDSYLAKNDYDGARRHLCYWLVEAEVGGDLRGKISVLNELVGLARKTGDGVMALDYADRALKAVAEAGLSGTVTEGTTLVNAATAYKAFGRNEDAMPYYRAAKKLYEQNLSEDDARLGALYNNMALAQQDTEQFKEARKSFEAALRVMERVPSSEPERAVTYCNLATLTELERGLEDGDEEIQGFLDLAASLLDFEGCVKDANYAYVCEKCAPVFGYYGHFLYEKDLLARAESIRK